MTLAAHPVIKFLANNETEVNLHIDHEALETIMNQEDNRPMADDLFAHILSPTRIVAKGDTMGIGAIQEVEGTLTSRIFSLLEETRGCKLQTEFRERGWDHPAYELIHDELKQALLAGSLNSKFDQIETTGAVVVYDKQRKLATIGLNMVAMRSNIREQAFLMADHKNARIIDRINGVPEANFTFEPKKKPEPHVEMSTTFYVTFEL